jgi:hypothetical protein
MAPKQQAKALNGPEIIDLDENGRVLPEDFDTTGLENDQDKLLDDIIGEFGAGDDEISYSASVTRIPKNFQRGQKEPWLFECDAADIIGIRTRLRDAYHGGQFRIRVYRTNNRGKKLYRQMDYSIEPPESVASATGDTKYDALSGALQRTQEQLLALADRLSNPTIPATPQGDPWVQMERMSMIMKNLRGDAPAHDPSGFTMKDGMELFTKGMELAENMRGDGGDSWISVFKEMAKQLPVADILQNLAQLKANPPQSPNQRQLVAPAIPQQRNTPTGNANAGFAGVPRFDNIDANNPKATGEQLEQAMRYLIGKARKNSDPALYAEWLLDNAEPTIIRQMAHDANVLDQLAVIFPGLTHPPIREWFAELIVALKDILAQMNGSGNDGAGIATPQSNGQDAGAARVAAENTGWGGGDQNNPQDYAIPGETGAA